MLPSGKAAWEKTAIAICFAAELARRNFQADLGMIDTAPHARETGVSIARARDTLFQALRPTLTLGHRNGMIYIKRMIYRV